jgi:hypothetical protein
MNTQFKQTQKMPKSGSFFNYLMSNNSSIPVAGEYATIMHYTDRSVVKVHSVSDCGKKVVLETLHTIADKSQECDMGHQNWIHQPTGQFWSIEYRNNGWKQVQQIIEFSEEFTNSVPEPYANKKYDFVNVVKYLQEQMPETHALIYGDDYMPSNHVEGFTKVRKRYNKVNILFGVARYYYDWEF